MNMNRFLHGLILLFVLIPTMKFEVIVDESLAEKDLYKVLGLTSEATIHEIKKAYRKLAQVHHPDKAKPGAKETNELIFREIAEANEVLSNAESRAVYDSMRHSYEMFKSRENYGRQQHSNYGDSGMGHDFYDTDDFDYFDGQSHDYHTGLRPDVNLFIPAGQVLFPYVSIISSPDSTHFALLDLDCSLGVYKGELYHLLQRLVVNEVPDMTTLDVEIKFRTEGDSSLRGMCFAVLDGFGKLIIYKGHPQWNYEPMWESDGVEQGDPYENRFKLFNLDLSNTGELAIRVIDKLAVRAGRADSKCVWSTKACDKITAKLDAVFGPIAPSIKALFSHCNEIRRTIGEAYTHLFGIISGFWSQYRMTDRLKILLARLKDYVDSILGQFIKQKQKQQEKQRDDGPKKKRRRKNP